MKKFKELLKYYANWNPPKIVVIAILILVLGMLGIKTFRLDNDFWFLINTGRYIVKNGFPVVEPFTIHEGFYFIPQQWLSDVIFYFIYNKFGIYGILILINIINVIFVIIVYKLMLLVSNRRVKLSLFVTAIATIFFSFSFLVSRPHIFDAIFLLLEIYLVELYIHRNKKIYLAFLPLISLLMINLHSSIWPMLFVFLLPYYVGRIRVKYFEELNYDLKPIIGATVLMILASFVNPYGMEAITYLFRSYGISYLNEIVGEMKSVNICEGWAVYLTIFVVIITYFIKVNNKNNKINLPALLLFLGTTLLGLLHYRGVLFFIIGITLAIGYNLRSEKEISDVSVDSYLKKTYIILSLIIMLFAGVFYGFVLNVQKEDDMALYEIANYLDENTKKDIKVYTNYNNGNYLEYRGYKCYLDTRAEVFLKANNKKEDILQEYYYLQTGINNYEYILSKYNFDYVLVDNVDIFFVYFDDDRYEKVFETSENVGKNFYVYRLYKRKDV